MVIRLISALGPAKISEKYYFLNKIFFSAKMPMNCSFVPPKGKIYGPEEDLLGALCIVTYIENKRKKMSLSRNARDKVISRLRKGRVVIRTI